MRNRWCFLTFLCLLAASSSLRAEDEPAPPQPVEPERVLLARVQTDPGGEATHLMRATAEALADESYERALAGLLVLAEVHPDVLLPIAQFGAVRHGRTDGALHWPVREAVNGALAQMPASWRARAEKAWLPRTQPLERRARLGELAALQELATSFGVTPQGGRALLLLADRALEDGRFIRAARRLERWLDLHPDAAEAERASVVVRLADALLAVEDAGALQDIGLVHHALRDVVVQAGGRGTSLGDRLAAARGVYAKRRTMASLAPQAAPAIRVPALEDLEAPVVLWSRSLRDPDYLRQGMSPPSFLVQAGAWGTGDTLVLHEGRVVRRLDTATGLERWRFPRRSRPTMHDIIERYQGHDIPWRSVTPAGDAVLVALGEPTATGRYEFLEAEYEADRLGQECRVRLACLDIATGRLRWHTGAVDEAHPVLGHRRTGVCSPPLVVGNDVYCLFAQRAGAQGFHLACLDLKTGRPRWVAPLGGGDSGRDDDESQGKRFTNPFVKSVPWGARPTLADGEICALPHAGFAAGVDAATGRVRWLRALPRHGMTGVVPASEGHSVQNAPVAWGDAWLLAPHDSPRLVCLARGSGDLRWQRGGHTPEDLPSWRDVLGIVRESDGRPWLRLSGTTLQRMRPQDGSLETSKAPAESWAFDGAGAGGRVLDAGPYALRAASGTIQGRAWTPVGEDARDATALAIDVEDAPAGDLLRVGRVWLVLAADRVLALAQPDAVAALLGTDDTDEPAVRATRLGVRARIRGDGREVAQAVEVARGIADADLRARAFHRLARDMRLTIDAVRGTDEELTRLASLAVVVRTLPAATQGDVLLALTRRLFALDAGEDAARLLVHWIHTADDTLVARDRHWDSSRDDRVRGDLLAARMLRKFAARPGVQDVIDKHERDAAATLASLKDGDEALLRGALRRAVGTRSAAQARRLLLRRLEAAGRFGDAAAVAADLRLDPPWAEDGRSRAERLREHARIQMDEASLLARSGQAHRARTLAADLERWSPPGLLDRKGRDAAGLSRALTKAFGWHPYNPDRPARPYPFPVWPREGGPAERDEVRSVEFLSLTGPGAEAFQKEYLPLVRGLTFEVWSLGGQKLVMGSPGPDQGWFGGSLRSVDYFVPGGGILVTSIVAGEPADGSGVRDGDWVHTWDGKPVTDLPAFMQLVASSEPGRTIPVGIWRHGRRLLTQFTSGRRPTGQARLLLTHEPLWVDDRGRVLVPGRTGLSWVDPAKATRTPHWTWRERGVVRRCLAVGGELFVTINRGLLPDLVVAVDLERGVERWRAEVRGAVTWVEPVGSALWIQTRAPGQGLVVDRQSGRPRAWYRTFDRHRHEFRKNWESDRETALAAGRAYVATGAEGQPRFRFVNTTRGTVEHEDSWPAGPREIGAAGRYPNPKVAAGAFVGVTRAGGIHFYFPDPLGGPPLRELQAQRRDFMGNMPHHGAIDSDARFAIRGHTIYLVRLPLQGRMNVNVHVYGIDYDALRRRPATLAGPAGPALFNRTHRAWLTGSSSPARYVLSVRPRFEGVFVSAAQLTGDHHAETWWIASSEESSHDGNRDLKLLWRDLRDARRHPPRRIGNRLFVPVDRGGRVFPVQRYRDEDK